MNPVPFLTTARAASLLLALSLVGCTITPSNDTVDYRSGGAKTAPLDVPPDLTQLSREGRYQPQVSVVSANAMRQGGTAAAEPVPTAVVAPSSVGDMRIERQGNTRWLVTTLAPEVVYPKVRKFWLDSGFVLATDEPKIGLLETGWAENRAKLPQDWLRRTIGGALDNLYSTGERDRFRTRIERTAAGTEIYITHRGMIETFSDQRKENTIWQQRPSDPGLEAEFLSRLMVALGAKEDTARTAVASAAPASAPAAAVAPAAAGAAALPATASLDIAEPFDRAWRQVGLALDRSGFTIEDRDRGAGLYFVRYIDPKLAGKEEPNFFAKLFTNEKEVRPQRLRVVVKADGAKSQVSVQTADGAPDNSEQARAIIGKLGSELR